MLQNLLRLFSRARTSEKPQPAGPTDFLRTDNLPDWRRLFALDPSIWEAARKAAAAGNGPTVLIATNVGGHGPVSVVESMLAVALTLRGAKVHTLLCDAALPACMRTQYDANVKPDVLIERRLPKTVCPGCYKRGSAVFSQLDLPQHKLSAFVTGEERAEAAKIAAEIPLRDIKKWRWDNLALGEHALAGALRYFARGVLDIDNPEEAEVLRRYIEAALLTARATTRIVRTEEIQHAAFHHGIYVPQGIVGEVCRREDVHVANWVVAYRQNTLTFSHDNTYHQTLMDEPVSEWENVPWTEEQEEQTVAYLRSRWDGGRDWIYFHEKPSEDLDAFAAEVGLDLTKPIVGMLTNVFWDAQLHFKQNAFEDMLSWALKTIEWFRDHPELQLLVRIHPAEIRGTVKSRQKLLDEIIRAIPELPKNVFIIPPENSLSTYAAMLACDSVIIYGTKMGVELTSIGIPVIVAGEAWIRNKGMTSDANSEAEYVDMLGRLPVGGRLPPETVTRARKYAYHFFFRRMVPLPFVQPIDVAPNFKISISGLGDLMPGRHPGLDVICDGIVNPASPFIYPVEQFGLHDAA